jgi:hypothetical protein
MRRTVLTLISSALVLSLATPATVAAATDRDEAPAKATAVTTSATPVAVTLNSAQFRASIDRAMNSVKVSVPAPPSASQGPAPVKQKPNTRIRKQGGGSTGLIIGLVSTVAGLAGTYYMVKMMKDQQEEAQNTNRLR